jgi:hypothetical protein
MGGGRGVGYKEGGKERGAGGGCSTRLASSLVRSTLSSPTAGVCVCVCKGGGGAVKGGVEEGKSGEVGACETRVTPINDRLAASSPTASAFWQGACSL